MIGFKKEKLSRKKWHESRNIKSVFLYLPLYNVHWFLICTLTFLGLVAVCLKSGMWKIDQSPRWFGCRHSSKVGGLFVPYDPRFQGGQSTHIARAGCQINEPVALQPHSPSWTLGSRLLFLLLPPTLFQFSLISKPSDMLSFLAHGLKDGIDIQL